MTEEYQGLKEQMCKVKVVRLVVSVRLVSEVSVQKSVVLGTAKILRREIYVCTIMLTSCYMGLLKLKYVMFMNYIIIISVSLMD